MESYFLISRNKVISKKKGLRFRAGHIQSMQSHFLVSQNNMITKKSLLYQAQVTQPNKQKLSMLLIFYFIAQNFLILFLTYAIDVLVLL